MDILVVAAVAACVAVLVPVTVLLVEVLAAMLPVAKPIDRTLPRPPVAVLIPAHNESLMIAATLFSVTPQLRGGDRVLVVADNCSDDTAAIAAAHGAEVVERRDSLRRGKGYALDYGMRHLESAAPAVVIVVDADCEVAPGSIDRLAGICASSGRPVQALYLMHAPADAGLKLRIAEFAWLIRNQVRPLGLRRLGLPCQLDGTGMAFPWEVIRQAALATGHIVEDMKLGVDLARAGQAAEFCPDASVLSRFPASAEGIASQRTRWEHGHLGMILGTAPRLFAEALWRRNGALLALALDLCVPPLALLLILGFVLLALGGGLLIAAGAHWPLQFAAASLAMLAGAVLLSWHRYGRGIVSLASLAYAPLYALRKIPVYLSFIIKRQGEWVRSKRGGA